MLNLEIRKKINKIIMNSSLIGLTGYYSKLANQNKMRMFLKRRSKIIRSTPGSVFTPVMLVYVDERLSAM